MEFLILRHRVKKIADVFVQSVPGLLRIHLVPLLRIFVRMRRGEARELAKPLRHAVRVMRDHVLDRSHDCFAMPARMPARMLDQMDEARHRKHPRSALHGGAALRRNQRNQGGGRPSQPSRLLHERNPALVVALADADHLAVPAA